MSAVPTPTDARSAVIGALTDAVDLPRLIWSALDTKAREAALQRPVQAVSAETSATVSGILARVQRDGDPAIRELCAQHDGVTLRDFEVDALEFAEAESTLDEGLRIAMREAADRIERFHRLGMAHPYAVETAVGVVCERIIRPIQRVGLYVPAGTAPLPSTALMLCIPAALADCRDVILCTPPRADGSADPAVLVAARLAGANRVFKIGGAQAIAAMAFGTASVPRCDKLFGPGNSYVTEAKQQVARQGITAIDMPAGPSEVLVIADAGADPVFVASDLLSQAEHGPDSQVMLISDSEILLEAVALAIGQQLALLPRAQIASMALAKSRLILVDTIDEAFSISNQYAPEHLILALRKPRDWLDKVEVAGSVFLGDYTPEALGDYCSGTNHVLPTNGAARAYSGVSVSSFQNFVSVQSATPAGIAAIGPSAITLANAEGLAAHASAVALRVDRVMANTRSGGVAP